VWVLAEQWEEVVQCGDGPLFKRFGCTAQKEAARGATIIMQSQKDMERIIFSLYGGKEAASIAFLDCYSVFVE
jgi:hypothetical protein